MFGKFFLIERQKTYDAIQNFLRDPIVSITSTVTKNWDKFSNDPRGKMSITFFLVNSQQLFHCICACFPMAALCQVLYHQQQCTLGSCGGMVSWLCNGRSLIWCSSHHPSVFWLLVAYTYRPSKCRFLSCRTCPCSHLGVPRDSPASGRGLGHDSLWTSHASMSFSSGLAVGIIPRVVVSFWFFVFNLNPHRNTLRLHGHCR
mmetsp:Transcript_41337/g.66411  ORF Transcript_41337/g.66411 Transcript_41337/m.66411 type:complete len:202 (-) Transcript_41337:1262-1867(-)